MRNSRLVWLAAVAMLAIGQFADAQQVPRETAGTLLLDRGTINLTLNTCAKSGTSIQCDFTVKSMQAAAVDYKYAGTLATSRLIDDNHIEHPQVTGYFVVGTGTPADTVTLVKDETVTMIQVFGGGNEPIKRVNVIFGRDYLTALLK